MKLNLLNSLRGRYALVTLVLSISLLTGSLLAQYNLTQSRDAVTGNIANRNQLLQHSRHIRTTIWEARESLALFLLMPNEQQYPEYVHLTIEQAIKFTEKLKKHPWIKEKNKTPLINQLRDALAKYDQAVNELIRVRGDPDKQYPSMAIARNEVQIHNSDLINALGIALKEIIEESHDVITPNYKKFMQIQHLWMQMISVFRIYLANSIGSYDVKSIPLQQQTITILYDEITAHINELKNMADAGKLGFESTDAVYSIDKSLITWRMGYEKILNVHKSQNWRADAAVVKNKIEPFTEEIWSILQTLDIAIESSSNEDVNNLAAIAERQVIVLWILTVIGLIFLFVGFYFLELLVLRPIANVSSALKKEATGDKIQDISTHTNIHETRNLIDAFDEMRLQVHERQDQLEHQALHDALTGLANRTLLFDRLQYSIRTSRRENKTLALLMLDLDRFKEVNDTLGHQIGDSLLVDVGQRLKDTLREADTVARLGGDEFAILLANTEEKKAQFIADKIHTALEEMFIIDDLKLYVKASVGIVLYPDHGKTANALLQKADVAMYVAKRNKLGQSIYDPEHDQHSVGRLALMSDLRMALNKDQLDLHYQPKVSLSDGNVIGFEALLRWQHKKYGEIPPGQVIPLAEQTGAIREITKWLIKKALFQLQQWHKQGVELNISINLSVYNIFDHELVQQITRLLADNISINHHLTFEITESAMMEQPELAVEVLTQFDKLGVRISIDDFGTGFSSLAYLKRLPVDELKIDKSFVMDMHNDENDAVIVRSTIDLAHNLGLEVVAEGIENQDIYDILSILGCDVAQGYHISHPLPLSKLQDWLSPGYSHKSNC
jgi:diguanylate cyclase (GGDEF)-like protein